MNEQNAIEKGMTFEAALRRLDEIVRQLEKGDVPLAVSLELFEEGTRLSKYCEDALKQAEQKVSILVKQVDGTVQEQRFTGETEKDDA